MLCCTSLSIITVFLQCTSCITVARRGPAAKEGLCTVLQPQSAKPPEALIVVIGFGVCSCSAPPASQWPRGPAAKGFAHLSQREAMDGTTAFAEVYCLSFQLLDHVWLQSNASYMEFNQVCLLIVVMPCGSKTSKASDLAQQGIEGLRYLSRLD